MKYFKDSPTIHRKAVPDTKLQDIEDIITAPQPAMCQFCGKTVPQSELTDHVYDNCELKGAVDEVQGIDHKPSRERELDEILQQKGYSSMTLNQILSDKQF